MRVRLNHICHRPDCAGVPGDELELAEALGQMLIDRGGAVRIDAAPALADVADSEPPQREAVADPPQATGQERPPAESAERPTRRGRPTRQS